MTITGTAALESTPTITWYTCSPDSGDECICSLCGSPILLDVPMRVFDTDNSIVVSEARFHADCFIEISYAFTGLGRRRKSTLPGYILTRGMLLPLRWQDDRSGQLPQVVLAFLNWEPGMKPLEPRLLRRLVDYLIHYIDAPCWNGNFVPEIANLRLQAGRLQSAEDIRAWITACMEIALDPL